MHLQLYKNEARYTGYKHCHIVLMMSLGASVCAVVSNGKGLSFHPYTCLLNGEQGSAVNHGITPPY